MAIPERKCNIEAQPTEHHGHSERLIDWELMSMRLIILRLTLCIPS
jgi:hypothetical protein